LINDLSVYAGGKIKREEFLELGENNIKIISGVAGKGAVNTFSALLHESRS